MADSHARRVRNYVQTLSQNDRYIVMLYYADGLNTTEISRVLELPRHTVKNRLQQLRTHLASLTTTKPHTPSTAPAPATAAISAYA